MKPLPLEELYSRFVPGAGAVSGTLLPPGIQREVGHFNIFQVADLMPGYRDKPPMTFDRRAYYKISLLRGRSRVEYADQGLDIAQKALWFATTQVPYRWLPHDLDQAGYFCLFTDEFLLPAKGARRWTSCRCSSRAAARCGKSRTPNTRPWRPFLRRWQQKLPRTTSSSTTCCAPTCWS